MDRFRIPKRAPPKRQRLSVLFVFGLLVLLFTTLLVYYFLPDSELKQENDRQAALEKTKPSKAFCNKSRPPMVCAHGGDTTSAPPNTAAAFRAAIALGADCVEIDAALSKDGILIVLHIRELQQLLTHSGSKQSKGVQVGDLTWTQISRLAWPTGEAVLTVREAVHLTSPYVDCVTLDVKTYQGKDGLPIDEDSIASSLVHLVHETHCNNCMIWAKSDKVVNLIKNLSPGQRGGFILMNETEEARAAGMDLPLRIKEAEVVGAHHTMVDTEVANILRAHGKQLYTWTINQEDVMNRVLNVGVDALVTNYPRMALDAIEARLARCGEYDHQGG